MLSAVISTTGVMLLLNNFVTPIYLVECIGMPETVATQTVIDMLPTVLFPFNLAKTLLNTGLTVFLYKPITRALRHSGLVVSKTKNENSNLKVIMLVFGAVALAVAATVLVIIW